MVYLCELAAFNFIYMYSVYMYIMHNVSAQIEKVGYNIILDCYHITLVCKCICQTSLPYAVF
jgi:hypothetical protein